MTKERNGKDQTSPRAGGAAIAFATLLGAVTGVALGQPSIGVIGGFSAGVAIALLIWYIDKKRP